MNFTIKREISYVSACCSLLPQTTDSQAVRPWDRLIFEDSYRELQMQAQYFNPNGQYRTFGELLHHVPAAERLHGLVSGVVLGYLRQLGGLMPDIADNLGRRFLRFENFRFEVINSDFQDPTALLTSPCRRSAAGWHAHQPRQPSAAHTSLLLHLWLQADPRVELATQQIDYELAALDNQLAPLVPGLPFALALGRFAGRREAVVQPAGKRLFACVLAGAFEVQGRLLHADDGLALWDCAEAELEALSNDALVLVLEP